MQRVLSLLVVFLLTVTACHTELTAVSVQRSDGTSVRVTEDPGMPTEEEGTVTGPPWATPVYLFDEPILLDDTVLTIRYRGTTDSLLLTILDSEAAPIHEVSLESPRTAGAGSMEVAVPLPSGTAVGGFQIALPCNCGSLELDAMTETQTPALFRRLSDGFAILAGTSYSEEDGRTRIELPPQLVRQPDEAASLVRYLSGVRVDLVTSNIAEDIQPEDVLEASFERPSVDLLVSAGAKERRLLLHPPDGGSSVYLYPEVVFDESTATIDSIEMNAGRRSVRITAVDVFDLPASQNTPIPAEPWTILTFPRDRWRSVEREVFEWAAYPGIFIIDFANYAVQADYFKRLAFFTEKRGFRGRIPVVEDVSWRHGWNAHNYSAAGLADFFDTAAAGGYVLTGGEEKLRQLALDLGLIVEEGGRLRPGEGGLLSVTRESSPVLRDLLMAHEAFHGVFYAREGFRTFVEDYWRSKREVGRGFWTGFLSYMTYDPADEYLMVNEFQAYILQQRPRGANWYFSERIGSRLSAAGSPSYTDLRNLIAEDPRYFWDAAESINHFVVTTENLLGGDVYGIRPAE